MVATVDGGCGSSDRGIPWRAWEGEVGRGPAVDGARRRKKRPVATACPWPERDAGRAHGRWRPARAGVRPDRRGSRRPQARRGEVGWARRGVGPSEGWSPKAASSREGWTRSGPASRGARGHGEHAATAKRRQNRGGMGKTCSRGPVVVLKMSSGRRRSPGSR